MSAVTTSFRYPQGTWDHPSPALVGSGTVYGSSAVDIKDFAPTSWRKSALRHAEDCQSSFNGVMSTLSGRSFTVSNGALPKTTGAITVFTDVATWTETTSGSPDYHLLDSGFDSFKSTQRTIIRSNAVEKVYGFQGLIFLAELHETVLMLKNLSTSYEALEELYRVFTKNLKAARSTRNLRKAYLGFTYGIMPLLNDMIAFNKQMKRLASKRHLEFIPYEFQETVQSTRTVRHTTPATYDDHQLSLVTRSCKSLICVKTSWPEETGVVPTLEQFGISVKQFVPALYEATKFSFVLDYFVNVGQWLQALSYCVHRVQYGHISFKSDYQAMSTPVAIPKPATWSDVIYKAYSVQGGTLTHRTIRLSRESARDTTGEMSLSVHIPTSRQLTNLIVLFDTLKKDVPKRHRTLTDLDIDMAALLQSIT